MFIYFFLFVIIGLAAFATKDRIIRKLAIFLLFAISAFRAETVGLDTINYVKGGLSEWSMGIKNMQFIYAWLTAIKAPNSHLSVIVFTTVITIGIIVSSKRFNVDYAKAFFFFILFEYFSLSMNIARQYAAIGLIIIGYSYLKETGRKKNLFFLFVLLAYGFHSSSLIALLAYPISYIDLSKVKQIYLITIIIVCFFMLRYVLKDYYLLWTQTVILPEDLQGYSLYFEQATDATLTLAGELIVFISLIVNIYIFLELAKDSTDSGRLIASLFFAAIIFDIFFSILYGNLGRVRYSIDIINIIAYAKYFSSIRTTTEKLVFVLMLVVFGYDLLYMLTSNTHAYGTVPYSFMF